MTSTAQDSGVGQDYVVCPQCGGANALGATRCEHCGWIPPAEVAHATGAPGESSRSKIIDHTLRELLVGRKLVSRESFERAATTNDVAAILAALAASGELTASQAAAQRETFRQVQQDSLKRLLDDCIRRGFTTQVVSEPVLASFEHGLAYRMPVEHLVHEGIITSKQAELVGASRAARPTPFAPPRPAYQRWVDRDDAPWRGVPYEALEARAHNQLFRNHALAFALRVNHAATYAFGVSMVVSHPRDTRCAASLRGYRELVTRPEVVPVIAWKLDEVVERFAKVLAGTEHAGWVEGFSRRYLGLGESEAVAGRRGEST